MRVHLKVMGSTERSAFKRPDAAASHHREHDTVDCIMRTAAAGCGAEARGGAPCARSAVAGAARAGAPGHVRGPGLRGRLSHVKMSVKLYVTPYTLGYAYGRALGDRAMVVRSCGREN